MIDTFFYQKLIKRTVFAEHTQVLMERQDAMLGDLSALAKEGFQKAQEEWEKTVVQWEKKQEKAKADAEAGLHPAEGESVDGKTLGVRQIAEDAGSASGVDQENKDPAAKDTGKEKEVPAPPSKKYRMTDAMKVIVWRLVLLSNELCRVENEKKCVVPFNSILFLYVDIGCMYSALEGSTVQVSEQGLRKILYQKVRVLVSRAYDVFI